MRMLGFRILRDTSWYFAVAMVSKMSGSKVEDKALRLLKAFENAGKSVTRVAIEGRRIEIVLSKAQDGDEFEDIDMRYGKT